MFHKDGKTKIEGPQLAILSLLCHPWKNEEKEKEEKEEQRVGREKRGGERKGRDRFILL